MTITTINSNTPRAQYTATASQTEFTYNWPIFAESDLEVYQKVGGGTPEASDILVLNTDYTVSGENTNDGGTVTLTTGATAGDTILIKSAAAYERTTAFSGALSAVELEEELNRIIAFVKQLNSEKLSQYTESGDSLTGNFDMGGFKITSLASGMAATDAVNYGQIAGIVATVGDLQVPVVDTLNGIRALDTATYSYAWAVGSATAGDGGGGGYYYDSSDTSSSDNGTTVLVGDDTTSRWKRFVANSAIGSASTSAEGVVELATDAEAQALADTSRAVTPSNLSAVLTQLAGAGFAVSGGVLARNVAGLTAFSGAFDMENDLFELQDGGTGNSKKVAVKDMLPPVEAASTKTLALGDAQKTFWNGTTSNFNLTIPPQSSVAFKVLTEITVVCTNTGTVTLVAGSGVNLVEENSLLTCRPSGGIVVAKLVDTASDTWIIAGKTQ